MFPLIAKERMVFLRIAVDNDGVSGGAWLQRAHPARHAQHLSADRCRRADDFDWRDNFLADGELLRLIPMQLAQKVAAVRNRDAMSLADLERLQSALQHDFILGKAFAGHAELGRP